MNEFTLYIDLPPANPRSNVNGGGDITPTGVSEAYVAGAIATHGSSTNPHPEAQSGRDYAARIANGLV